MNRRNFLKRMTGYSLGLASLNLALPSAAKAHLVSPITHLVDAGYLNRRIRTHLARLKKHKPGWKFGETHCHSTFSDGTFEVEDILLRASSLGLDYLIITEHLTAGEHLIEPVVRSIATRHRVVSEMDHDVFSPVEVYPGFEISTQQGHLILVFPKEYFGTRYLQDIKTVFQPFESRFPSMETAARWGRALGGISIVPHPEIERSFPFGASIDFIRHHLTGLVDGIEDISTGHGYRRNYSESLGLAAIGSSDDHFNFVIGTTVTGYDAVQYPDFLSAVRARSTQAIQVERSLTPIINAARTFL